MPTTGFSDVTWRKSSRSTQNGSCIEVTATPGEGTPGRVVAVRDSKDPDGPALTLTPGQWRMFTRKVKAGTFDLS